MITKNVRLYLGDGFPVRIPVSQYDTMWRFVFSIINGSVEWTIPTGATAVLNGRKPDGNVIAISGTIADNKVTVDATEQMTVVAGEVVCELSIMSGGAVVGTANFILAVEDAPKKDGEPISESDLSAYAEMIEAAGELVGEAQEIIAHGPFLPSGGTPGQVLTKTATGETWDDVSGLPDGGNNGQVLTKTGNGAAWSDAGTPTQAQTNAALAGYLDEHPEAVTNIPDRIKQALLACFQKVAWVDANGQTYYQNLYNALTNKEVLSIAAVFTQGSAVIYNTDSLDTLRQYLVVTASYDDGTTGEVTAYELSGTLTEGTSTITATYSGKTATFNVIVVKSRETTFGAFSDGVTVIKATHIAQAPHYNDQCCTRSTAAARACAQFPIVNNNYVFTVTNASKYNLVAYDVQDLTKIAAAQSSGYVDSYVYLAGSKSIAWAASDSASTPYVWLALKKMDGTAFTESELANGAEAVFTYTEGA